MLRLHQTFISRLDARLTTLSRMVRRGARSRAQRHVRGAALQRILRVIREEALMLGLHSVRGPGASRAMRGGVDDLAAIQAVGCALEPEAQDAFFSIGVIEEIMSGHAHERDVLVGSPGEGATVP